MIRAVTKISYVLVLAVGTVQNIKSSNNMKPNKNFLCNTLLKKFDRFVINEPNVKMDNIPRETVLHCRCR